MMLSISPYQTMMVITSAMTCFCFFLSFFFFNFFSLMMMVKTMTIVSFVTAFPETPPQKLINILSPRLSFALFRRPKREERSADQRRRERYSTAFFRVFFFFVVV